MRKELRVLPGLISGTEGVLSGVDNNGRYFGYDEIEMTFVKSKSMPLHIITKELEERQQMCTQLKDELKISLVGDFSSDL